jgi:hypothetical protein
VAAGNKPKTWMARKDSESAIPADSYLFGKVGQIPSGKLTKLWKITIFNGKIHYKWPFSIAMLVYQRVNSEVSPTTCCNVGGL